MAGTCAPWASPNTDEKPQGIFGYRGQSIDELGKYRSRLERRTSHFVERRDRALGLLLERMRAAVPEHRRERGGQLRSVERSAVEGGVDDGHRVPRGSMRSPAGDDARRSEAGPRGAYRDAQTIGVGEIGMVAGGARHVASAGEDRIPEKESSELDLLRRRGIVERQRHAGRRRQDRGGAGAAVVLPTCGDGSGSEGADEYQLRSTSPAEPRAIPSHGCAPAVSRGGLRGARFPLHSLRTRVMCLCQRDRITSKRIFSAMPGSSSVRAWRAC